MKAILLIAILFSASLSLAEVLDTLPIRDLEKSNSNLAVEGLLLIDNATALKQISTLANVNVDPVDFKKELVLIHQDGQKPSGAYFTSIVGVTNGSARFIVTVERFAPGKGCMITADIVRPFHAVAISNQTRNLGGWWENKPLELRYIDTLGKPCR